MTGPVSDDEFAARRAAVLSAAEARGLDGLLVCGRGGGTLDRYANIFYLTNFYSSFPYIPDYPGHWSGRAHSYLVLPRRGPARLIADLHDLAGIALPPEQVVVTDDVIGALVEALEAAAPGPAKWGLVGEDTQPVSHYRELGRRLPGIDWVPAEDILTACRAIKSAAEVGQLRAAAALGSRVIEAMMEAAAPGASHGDIVAAGMLPLVAAGGVLYNSFMASGKGGPDATMVRHGFPTWGAQAPLEDGQWLRLGISGVYRGYYFDVSRSRAIGPASNAQIDAFEAAIEAVQTGIAAAQPGVTAGAAAAAGLDRQVALGYPLQGAFSGLGHGIGLGWDAPWLVPDEAMEITPGMVLNFERTLSRDGFLGDFEETVLITDRGPELLTNARIRYW